MKGGILLFELTEGNRQLTLMEAVDASIHTTAGLIKAMDTINSPYGRDTLLYSGLG